MDNWGETRKPGSWRRYGPGPFAPKKKGCGGKKAVVVLLLLTGGNLWFYTKVATAIATIV